MFLRINCQGSHVEHQAKTSLSNAAFIVKCLFHFVVFLCLSSLVQAKAPDTPSLTPAGGQIGSKVVVQISGANKSTSIWCSDPNIKIQPDSKEGTYLFDIPKETLPGHCWIRLYNNEGASDLKAFLLGTLTETTEKEPNNRLSETGELLKLPVTINGVLHKGGEVDSYGMTLKKGETVIASMSANELVGSPMDPVLQIVSQKGFVLEQNDDYHGFDPQIVFTAPQDGTFYVRTFSFPSTPNQSISYSGSSSYIYRLTITNGPFIDFSYPLNINRQPEATTSVMGWNIPENLKNLPVHLLPESDQALIVDPSIANSYQIETVKHPTLIEKNPDQNSPQSIMIPSSVTGIVEKAGDVDSYQFLASKNQTIEFQIRSTEFGHPLDSVMTLKDATGKILSQSDDSGSERDAKISYQFKENGTYSIEVTDRFSHGGMRYVYLLTSTEQEPDYTIDVPSNAFVIPADKPLEIKVSIKRVLFNQKLKIRVTGLPKEIEAKEVISEGSGDSSKSVTLVLKNNGTKIWNGPVQILSEAEADPNLTREASAPIAGQKKRTKLLWLTALEPKKPEETKPEEGKDKK